jgi:hypothetical protein
VAQPNLIAVAKWRSATSPRRAKLPANDCLPLAEAITISSLGLGGVVHPREAQELFAIAGMSAQINRLIALDAGAVLLTRRICCPPLAAQKVSDLLVV